MSESLTHDVFLSYSSNDTVVVRAVAERLRADGLRVWFDEWEIRPGDSIPAKIEEGLEHSRVLVLCMSANAFLRRTTKLGCRGRCKTLMSRKAVMRPRSGAAFGQPSLTPQRPPAH